MVENGSAGFGTATPTSTVHIVGQCVTGDTLLKRRRRRRRKSSELGVGGPEPEPDEDQKQLLINLTDLISKKIPNPNDQARIKELKDNLGIRNLDLKYLLGQLEQLEIRNSHDYIYD